MLSCHVGWNTSHNFEKYITARFGQELSKCVAEVAKTRSRERHSDHTKQAFKGQETRKSRSSLSVHGMMALQWKLLVLTELESIGYTQYIFTECSCGLWQELRIPCKVAWVMSHIIFFAIMTKTSSCSRTIECQWHHPVLVVMDKRSQQYCHQLGNHKKDDIVRLSQPLMLKVKATAKGVEL